ncbi:MAG: serine--tRNA ligase [bacterium]|nr:serine--tRNA ligase [bacterium]
MLDINFVKENLTLVKNVCRDKNIDVDVDRLVALNLEIVKKKQEIDGLNAERNKLAKSTGGGKPTEEQLKLARELKEKIATVTDGANLNALEKEYVVLLEKLPNIPTGDTPIGKNEDENVVLSQWGEIKKLDFKPREHWEIAEKLNLLDTERATKVSGSRFVYLRGDLVLLQYALIQQAMGILMSREALAKIIAEFGLSVSDKPFTPVIPPVIVKAEVMQRMARLEPKEERYHIEQDDLYLVGSAEHTLGPTYMDETLNAEELPIRLVGVSSAFRREAGSYGKDTKGMIRLHQFEKCEMESFSAPDASLEEHKLFSAIQETLMRTLNIPYQVILKCTGDMGTPNARAADIEAWFPGQNKYRETHTADYMTDYQTRRLKTKIKMKDGTTTFAHMNDGTAFAGRTIAAIIENYQQEDGSVIIPEVLRGYFGGREKILAV